MVRRWPPPTYETEMEVGLPHERQFTIACIVLKYYEVGKGKSKKIAKRQAAHKMWLMLQQQPLDATANGSGAGGGGGHGGELGANDEENRVINRYADLKDANIPTLTNQHSYKVSQFHKTMKATCSRNLAMLQVGGGARGLPHSPNMDCCFPFFFTVHLSPKRYHQLCAVSAFDRNGEPVRGDLRGH